MVMQAPISRMRSVDSTIKAGAFSSDGLEIETPWHFHDLHQLLYAFEDSVEVEDESARYKVPHQFAAWIPAGTVHRTVHQRVRSGSVFFHVDMIDWPVDSLRVVPVSNLMREMIIHAMRWPIDGVDDETSLAYFDCFARLCGEWITHEVTLVLPSSNDPRINAIVNFTRANLATVTLQDACNVVSMSERSLRRHFLKAMGISWEDFRLRLRIYMAIEDLDTTNKPISEIAVNVGYTSQTAFAKAFRAIMGIGPTAYRRAQR
jgi:AraC-like DNA-binding protein